MAEGIVNARLLLWVLSLFWDSGFRVWVGSGLRPRLCEFRVEGLEVRCTTVSGLRRR